MKNKTIFWIIGIILVWLYIRCEFTLSGSRGQSCATDSNGNFKFPECGIWRMLKPCDIATAERKIV